MTSRWVIAIPLIFLAFMIGILNLYDGIVSQAEANSLRHLGLYEDDYNTIEDVLDSIVRLSPQHAPLYFITLNFWYQIFGSDPGILRLLSVFSGVLTVAMVYRLGVLMTPKRGGIYASLLLMSSWAFMYYIHEIRQYALLLFVSSLLFWMYWNIVSRKSKVPKIYWVGLYLTSALSIYLHYFGILSLIGIGVYHLVFVKKTRRWFLVGVVEALAGITFLPWYTIMRTGMTTMPDLSDRSLQPLQVVYEFLFFHGNGLWFILLILILLVAWNYRRLTPPQHYGFVVFIVMFVAIFVIHQLRPILFVGRLRYIIILLPILALTLSIGVAQLRRFESIGVGLIAILFASAFVFTGSDSLYDYAGLDRTPSYDQVLEQMIHFPGMNETLISLSVPEDNVIVAIQVREYYGKLMGRRIQHWVETKVFDNYSETLDKIARNDVGFWLLYYPNSIPLYDLNIYNELFLKQFRDCGTFIDEDNLQLIFMLRADLPCDFVYLDEARVKYDAGMDLSNAMVQQVDDMLDVYIWWEHIPSEQYGVSLQVFDDAGNRMIQDDFVVVDGMYYRQYEWGDMPAGTYDVQMILYTLEDTSSIGGQFFPDNVHFDRSFSIGTVTVD